MYKKFVEHGISNCGSRNNYRKCRTCSDLIILNGDEGALEHLQEENHVSKVDSLLWSNIPRTDSIREIESLTEKDYHQIVLNNITFSENTYFCNICCKRIDIHKIKLHYKKKKHVARLQIDFVKLFDNGIYLKYERYTCNACNQSFKYIKQAESHVISEDHRKLFQLCNNFEKHTNLHETSNVNASVTENKNMNIIEINEEKQIEQLEQRTIEEEYKTKLVMSLNVIKKTKDNLYKCKACVICIPYDELFNHINETDHLQKIHFDKMRMKKKQKVATERIKNVKENFYLHCKKCNVYLTRNEDIIQNHTMIHLYQQQLCSNIDIIQLDNNTNKVVIECLLCNDKLNNDEEFAIHVKSEKHLRNLFCLRKDNHIENKKNIFFNKNQLLENKFDPNKDYCASIFCTPCKKKLSNKNLYIYVDNNNPPLDQSECPDCNNFSTDINLQTLFRFYKCYLCDLPQADIKKLCRHYSQDPHYKRINYIINNPNAKEMSYDLHNKRINYIVNNTNAEAMKVSLNRKMIVQENIIKDNFLIVSKQSYKCKVCEIDFESLEKHVGSTSHLLGVHKRRIRELEFETYIKENNLGDQSLYYYCKKCDVYFRLNETLIQCHCMFHLQEENKSFNVDIITFIKQNEKIVINCSTCNYMMFSDEEFLDHVDSSIHLRRLQINCLKRTTPKSFNLQQCPFSNSENEIKLEIRDFDPKSDLSLKYTCSSCHEPECKHDCIELSAQQTTDRNDDQITDKTLNYRFNYFKCFLCDLPFPTIDVLIFHYRGYSHKHRLANNSLYVGKPIKRRKSESEESAEVMEEVDTEKQCLDEAGPSGINSETKPSNDETKMPIEGSVKETIKRKDTKARNGKTWKTRKPVDVNRMKRDKKERRKLDAAFPYNKDLLDYGEKYLTLCIEPGENNIYNFSPEEVELMRDGLCLILPVKKSCRTGTCLACNYEVDLDLGKLYTHLQHETHKANLEDLKSTGCSDEDSEDMSYLDLAKEAMLEESDEVVKCLLCKQKICNSTDELDEHMRSSAHKSHKSDWLKSVKKLKDELFAKLREFWYEGQNFLCAICRVEFSQEIRFVRHLEQPDHLKRLQGIERPHGIGKCLECASCWYGAYSYEEHCQEEFHQHPKNFYLGFKKNCRLMLNDCETIANEMLEQSDKLIESDKDMMEILIEDIEDTVDQVFPRAKAYCFGSRNSGLALPGSDADIFLDCEDVYYSLGSKQASQAYIRKLKKAFFVVNPHRWTCRVVLLKPRVPIVRMIHEFSGIQCDVSFLNGLGVEKTNLIRMYVMAYKHCRAMILFLKKWLDELNLFGSASINAYAVTWLVIFFLQCTRMLPSVNNVKRKGNTMTRVGGWECDFVDAIQADDYDRPSFKDLLFMFFDYYSGFDFCRDVICPLLGRSVSKQKFANVDNLPQEMDTYINLFKTNNVEFFRYDSPMCIQDPVDLTQNITKHVCKNKLREFKSFCERSSDIFYDQFSAQT